MATQPLSIVDSQPLDAGPSGQLSIVKSEPYQPPRSNIGDHVSAFFRGLKTAPIAHPMDVLHSTADMVSHPMDTLNSIESSREDLANKAIESFKKGDYGPGVIHSLLSLIPLAGPAIDQHYKEMKDAQAKGDTVGEAEAAGKLFGIGASAELARRGPKIAESVAEKVPEAAATVGTALKGAAKGGVETSSYHGVPIPTAAASAIAGKYAAHALGLPGELGAVVGAAAPVVRGAYRELMARRAAQAEAAAATEQAARQLADHIRGTAPPAEPSPVAAAAATPETPTVVPATAESPELTGELSYEAPPAAGSAIPPARQLPPASQIQTPPPPNPVTDYVPPSGPDTTGPIPTDPTTGRPLGMGPAPSPEIAAQESAAKPPVAPNEFITRDEISQSKSVGLPGKPYASLKPGSPEKKVVDDMYDQIHGTKTAVETPKSSVEAAAAEPEPKPAAPEKEPNWWMTPAEKAKAAAKDAAKANPEPLPVAAQVDEPATALAPEEPKAEAVKPTASRVVNIPGDPSKEFAPSKLMSEEGLAQYAKDNGIPEDDARAALSGEGYQIAGRAHINRALHGIASELGMDHDTLSDVAKIKHRVKSMTQLSQEDMLGIYEDLLDKRSASEPLVPKGKRAGSVK